MSSSKPLIAISCAVGASVFFSTNDMAIKLLSGGYALHQIMLVRSVVALLITLAIMMRFEGGLSALITRRPLLHGVRGMLVVCANLFFFLGLASVPLAEATAVFFVAPLLITGMSVVFLRENVGLQRWAAIAVGLIGVVLIVRPGTSAFQWAALLPVLAAFSYASIVMTTRMMRMSERPATMAFYAQFAFLLFSGALGLTIGDGRYAGSGSATLEFMFRQWQAVSAYDLSVMACAGVMIAFGGYLFARAYSSAEAAVVAPFEYAALVAAIFWGLTIFGEWPDATAFFGILLILGSGLFVVWREARSRKPKIEHPRPSIA